MAKSAKTRRAERLAKGYVVVDYDNGEKWFSPEMLTRFEVYHNVTPGTLSADIPLLRELTREWAESVPSFSLHLPSIAGNHNHYATRQPLTWAWRPENV